MRPDLRPCAAIIIIILLLTSVIDLTINVLILLYHYIIIYAAGTQPLNLQMFHRRETPAGEGSAQETASKAEEGSSAAASDGGDAANGTAGPDTELPVLPDLLRW